MKTVIYTLATKDYLPLMDLWLRQAQPFLSDKQLIVRAMDSETAAYCAQRGISALADIDKTEKIHRNNLFILRTNDIHALAREHGELIHTDLDAFWLADITESIAQIDADIIITRELGIPASAVKAWGFSLCSGFFYIRYSKAIESFLSEWDQWVRIFGCDQLALNRIFLRQPIKWQQDEHGDCVSTICNTKQGNIRVTAVDLELAGRVFPATQTQSLIAHPWIERDLFPCYIKLLEFLWKRFDRLNPAADNFPKPQEDLSGCDQCTRNTLMTLELALSTPSPDPDFLYLKGALLLRSGLIETGLRYMLRAYRAAPDAIGAMSLYRMVNYVQDEAIRKEITEKIVLQLRQSQTPLPPGDALKLAKLLIKNKTLPTFVAGKTSHLFSYLYFRLWRKLYDLG